jgi:hypothetical protein
VDFQNERFMNTLLIHQMSPNHRELALYCGYYSDLFKPINEEEDGKGEGGKSSAIGASQLITGGPLVSENRDSSPEPIFRSSAISETILTLPITLDREGTSATVFACPDTGAGGNFISHELATALGCSSYQTTQENHRFSLPNGKFVESMGQVTFFCTFSTEATRSEPITCVFHVLSKLSTPLIVGMNFLQGTNTLTDYRNRFRRIPRPGLRAKSVYAVGRPKTYMVCDVNHELTTALPDSGSEYDLVSLQFAVARGFEIHRGTERTEVADGSTMFSCGFIRTTLSIGTHFDSKHAPRSKVAIAIDFDVIEGLPHDVVIGERHLEELRVFTDNKHALITSSHATTVEELNHIRCPGPIDKSLSWIKQRLGSGEELNPTASGN